MQQKELETWKMINQEGGEMKVMHRREDAGVRHTDLQAAALAAASPMIAAEWLFDRYKVAVDMVSLANEHDNERLFC